MDKFGYMERYGYEQLCFFHDKSTGLKAITCIHNTVLGPSLGGTRVWNYKDEEEAVEDVLRLARGMTYKSALAGLSLGGGKSVILADAEQLRKDPARREAFWRAFGRFVEGLNGRYITAADVGSTAEDLVFVHKETDYVAGLPGHSGDPSPFTALGVFKSMLACCKFHYGEDSVKGKTVAVQGLGKVGYSLCKLLHDNGANIIVTDIDNATVERAVKEFGAKAIGKDEVYGAACDIYSPCALGATVNDETIGQFKCRIICGGANNQLKDPAVHGPKLRDKGIVYAPDYLANAGGVINVFHELAEGGYDQEASTRMVNNIYNRMYDVLTISKDKGLMTYQTADKMAEDRIKAVQDIQSIRTNWRKA